MRQGKISLGKLLEIYRGHEVSELRVKELGAVTNITTYTMKALGQEKKIFQLRKST